MKMIKQIAIVCTLLLSSIGVMAQVYGTWGYDSQRRVWVPPGVPVTSGIVGTGSSVSFAASGVLPAQPQVVSGERCSLKDRVVSGGFWGAVGNVVGLAAGDVALRATLTAIGIGAGASNVACDPHAVDDRQVVRVIRKTAPPTIKNGHTCSVLDGEEVLADFLDPTRNQDGIEVESGEECQKAKDAFKKNMKKRS